MAAKVPSLIIKAIVAMDEERGIGKDGGIPWKLPKDEARMKKLTMGHPLIMGRKTFESMGKPLPGRRNIVLTRHPGFKAPGAVVVQTLDQALTEAAKVDDLAYIFGGEEIYKIATPVTDIIEMTHVSGKHGADTFFPEFEQDFEPVRSEALEDGGHQIRFVDYERRSAAGPA